ncbi:MAG: DUF4238 domain-containing protein, partial [Acholeplasmataceae bacterium]|nr:DUF4238 domain-containing protein [Acholeplasmataceae bacterium]
MNDPIKHHFIPQFILRNFVNSDDQLFYWNIGNKKLENRNTKSVYMAKNLYRDEENHPTNPAVIEQKFAMLEAKIAQLFQEKILDKNPITITRTDNELLRKFLYLLTFRSETRKKQYIEANFDDFTKAHLNQYVKDGDYVDLWLREIEMIIDNERYFEIIDNKNISWTIKTDFINHLDSYYMTFVTSRGQDFIISDVYPTAEVFPLGINNANLYPHYIYPLTPSLALILNHIAFKTDPPMDKLSRMMVMHS